MVKIESVTPLNAKAQVLRTSRCRYKIKKMKLHVVSGSHLGFGGQDKVKSFK